MKRSVMSFALVSVLAAGGGVARAQQVLLLDTTPAPTGFTADVCNGGLTTTVTFAERTVWNEMRAIIVNSTASPATQARFAIWSHPAHALLFRSAPVALAPQAAGAAQEVISPKIFADVPAGTVLDIAVTVDNCAGFVVDSTAENAGGLSTSRNVSVATTYTTPAVGAESTNVDASLQLIADDADMDGIHDLIPDNCPHLANAGQADADEDGLGDACDEDRDGDADLNAADNCPGVSNADQANEDGDALGDACDPIDDRDPDGDDDLNLVDNCPFDANADQADADADGIGDVCDTTDGLDVDDDGDLNSADNCPFAANDDQADGDADGIGDACDTSDGLDVDGDGDLNTADNCPFVANADQADGDGDGLGDVCDLSDGTDADGDGVGNGDDNCPFDDNADQADEDTDGAGDACDSFVDGEGGGCAAGGGTPGTALILLAAGLLVLALRPGRGRVPLHPTTRERRVR